MADKQHILIVDDDAHILASLQMLLSMEGYQVTLCSAVEQVPVQLSQHDFDLILMDMNYQRDTTSGQEGLVLLDEIEERLLCQRMAKFDGNAIKAARSLGLSRSAFYRRLEKYKINHE